MNVEFAVELVRVLFGVVWNVVVRGEGAGGPGGVPPALSTVACVGGSVDGGSGGCPPGAVHRCVRGSDDGGSGGCSPGQST